MNDIKAYYSLVQFCPDLSRAEAVNIGVLLFSPEAQFISVRLQRSNQRVRRFFGASGFDADRLNAAKLGLKNRFEIDRDRFRTLADLESFIATRGNEVQLTAPRSIKVADPRKDLDCLFVELVGGRAPRRAASSIIKTLDEALRRPSLAPRIRFDEAVVVPVSNRTIEIPYAYRNGIDNLIKPHVFGTSKPIDAAERLAIEGDLIHKHPVEGLSRRLVVVSDVDVAENRNELRATITNLLSQYNVHTVWPEQIPSLIDEVDRLAH